MDTPHCKVYTGGGELLQSFSHFLSMCLSVGVVNHVLNTWAHVVCMLYAGAISIAPRVEKRVSNSSIPVCKHSLQSTKYT